MSLKATEKVDANRTALTVEIDEKTFAEAVKAAAVKGSKDITIRGFRKGKAPLNMIYKMYGEEIFYEDALNAVYPEAVDAALKESGIDYIHMDPLEVVSMDKSGVVLKLVVTAKPEVTLGEYKGLKAERTAVKVEEDEVMAEINRLQERNARIIPVEDRPAALGDTVSIDFEGFVDDKAFDGGKAEGYSLELGSGSFIPGFEDQVAGHSVNEEFDVNVTFPEGYQAEELAGKPAVFKIKLHEIKAKELPAIDDEFAKDVSEYDTLDELKQSIHDKIEDDKNARADAEVENAIVEQIVEGMKVEVPDCMIEERIEDNVRNFENQLRYQGLDLKTYMKYTQMDEKDFREGFRENATKQVKVRLALEEIAKQESINASEEEVNAEYTKLAEMYKMDVAQIKLAIPEKDIAGDLNCNKAIDLVKNAAVVSEAKPAAKKPAAKKPAAKKAAPKAAEGEAKPAAKKPAAKKAAPKTAEGEAKPAAKKPAAKKAAPKAADGEAKPAAKKPAAKKAAPKAAEGEAKPAAKKPAAKKPAAKKEKAE